MPGAVVQRESDAPGRGANGVQMLRIRSARLDIDLEPHCLCAALERLRCVEISTGAPGPSLGEVGRV